MNYFDDSHRIAMVAARDSLHDALQPVAETAQAESPSFEGFVLFQQDAYHPDSAGAIAQINASAATTDRLKFQNEHVVNRRIDLEVSALGDMFQHGRYELTESRMNPEQHLVAGIHVPEVVGSRAASVFQLAFTKELGAPSKEQLALIHAHWERVAPECFKHLETLHNYVAIYPNHSVSDALELDVPTTPNAFLLGWDTSGSRQQAAANYGKLRSDLTLRGQRFNDIVSSYGGHLMRPTGDGQMFALELPVDQVDRLSDASIATFAAHSLTPLVRELLETSRSDGRGPLRWTADLGRIEHTTFDMSSPTIFEDASVSDHQPHDRTTIAFGSRALQALNLDAVQIDALYS